MKPATTLDHPQQSSSLAFPDSRLRDSRLAPLDPDTQSQILDLFIAGHMDLSTIAAMNNITFTQLIDFLESPRVVERLAAIQRLCERRAAIMTAEARCVALARLRTIAEHQPEPRFTPPKLFTRELETTRKAAAQLMRMNPPPRGEVSGVARRRGSSSPPQTLVSTRASFPTSQLATSRAQPSFPLEPLPDSRPRDSRLEPKKSTGAHLERRAPVCAASCQEPGRRDGVV